MTARGSATESAALLDVCQRLKLLDEAGFWPVPKIPVALPPATLDEVELVAVLASFKRAMRFRRTLQRALRALGVSFAERRLLDATARLIHYRKDAVSHQDIARELALDESSVSGLMDGLSERGLVDHDIDAWARCLLVLLTDESEWVVAAGKVLAIRLARRAGLSRAPNGAAAEVAADSVGAFELLAGGFPAEDAAFEERDREALFGEFGG